MNCVLVNILLYKKKQHCFSSLSDSTPPSSLSTPMKIYHQRFMLCKYRRSSAEEVAVPGACGKMKDKSFKSYFPLLLCHYERQYGQDSLTNVTWTFAGGNELITYGVMAEAELQIVLNRLASKCLGKIWEKLETNLTNLKTKYAVLLISRPNLGHSTLTSLTQSIIPVQHTTKSPETPRHNFPQRGRIGNVHTV